MAVTGWLAPAANTVQAGSGTWTSDTSIRVDDGVEATFSLAVKNTTGRENRAQNFGLDSAIPDDAIIVKVEFRVEWRVNSTAGVGILEAQAYRAGVAVGTLLANSAEPTVLTTATQDITSARQWTKADLLNGTFEVAVRGRNGNSATDPSYRFDHVAVQVTYLDPNVVAYRAYADDAALGAATPLAGQSTAFNVQDGDNTFRLRFEVQETAGGAGSIAGSNQNAWHYLQYRKNSGAWTTLTAATSNVRTFASTFFTEGDDPGNVLTAGTGTYNSGDSDKSDALVSIPFGASGNHTELEFALQLVGADVAPGDVLEFRLRSYIDANRTVSQSVTPTLNVTAALTSVQQTLSPNYTVVAQIQKTLSPSYNVIAQVQKALSSSYSVAAQVQKALSASYNIDAAAPSAVSKALSASYTVRTAVIVSLAGAGAYGSGAYGLGAYGVGEGGAQYLIRNVVSKALSASYSIASVGSVQQSLSASYSVRTALSKALSASYNVQTSVSKALSASYTVRAAATKSLSSSYTVQAQLSKSLSASYSVSASIPKTLAATYNVKTSIIKALSATYTVATSISKVLSASYTVRATITKALSASYSVTGTPGVVTKQLSASYSVRASIQKAQAASYFVTTLVSKPLAASYTVKAAATKALSGVYTVRAAIVKSLTPNYVVFARIQQTITPTYFVTTSTAKSLPAAYVVTEAVSLALPASYTVRQSVTQTFTGAWIVTSFSQVTKQQTFTYIIEEALVWLTGNELSTLLSAEDDRTRLLSAEDDRTHLLSAEDDNSNVLAVSGR